jgi:alpha-aminoadipate carrier protein LysW
MAVLTVLNGTQISPFVAMKSQYLRTNFALTFSSENSMVDNSKHGLTKCPDCDCELAVPADTEKGEILSCPGCGLELEVIKSGRDGDCICLQELNIQGEDWGE